MPVLIFLLSWDISSELSIIISNTVDAVCSEKCSGFSSSCPGTSDHFVSQTAGSMFHSHLANISEHQRQLWAQSSPGSLRWFALLPALAGDPDLSGSCKPMLGEGKSYNDSVQLSCSCPGLAWCRRALSTAGEGCASSSCHPSCTEAMEGWESH